MSHYVHHVPGRLRVKSPRLKRNEVEAARAKGCIGQLPGVRTAEVNTVTGSLLVTYDVNHVGSAALFASLRDLGHLHPEQGGLAAAAPGIGQKLSDTLVNKLLETVIERSATALIAAII